MPTVNAKNKSSHLGSSRPKPHRSSSHSTKDPSATASLGAAGKHSTSEPSRGYLKIAAAASALKVDFRGKTVLDIGSSTGGFTQYALDRGASKVIAVEKGTRQMAAPLRFDPRVELHEKTDIFAFHCPAPDLILADVSFVSLTKVLMYAKLNLTRPKTELLVMCKPQFEASPRQLTRGVIKNSKTRRQVLANFETWLRSHGFVTLAKRDNTLPGRSGNLERFYHLKLC